MDPIKAPEKMNFDIPNLSHAWKKWKEEFSLYSDLAMDDKDDKYKVKMFKYLIGTRGREIYDTVTFAEPDETQRTQKHVLDAFDSYCNPEKNESVERYKFNSRVQQSGESISKYVTELKLLAATCGFGILEQSLIRDRILVGILDTQLRERLLREKKLTLKSCEEICRASELSKENIKEIESNAEVHSIRSQGARPKTHKDKPKPKPKCKYCGGIHEFVKEKCPAYGKICDNCEQKDHFAKVCNNKPTPKTPFRKKRKPRKPIRFVQIQIVETTMKRLRP